MGNNSHYRKVTPQKKTQKIPTAAIAAGVCALLVFVVAIVVVFSRKKPQAMEEETEVVATAEVEEHYDASAGVLDTKKFDGTVLIETKDAGIEYVESTLFLGDSNTARFLNEVNPETKKTYASKENSIGVVGMGIDAISSLACMDFSSGRYTMPQSVAILQPERVIITMGTNNLYGTSTETDSFIQRYSTGIKAIEKAYPSVDIIVNSIPPVTKNSTYRNVTMTQIDAYNSAIAKMCKENNWKYLNSAEALKDEKTGYAKDAYMSSKDGLHFSNDGLAVLFKYVRTHSWITDDDRPKPLKTIPKIIGVPAGLIKTDPLTKEEFKEDPATIQETAEAVPTATPTPEATATPTPTPTANPGETACVNAGYKWTNNTCACPVNMIWSTSSLKCVCNTGYVMDANGACVVQAAPTPEMVQPTPEVIQPTPEVVQPTPEQSTPVEPAVPEPTPETPPAPVETEPVVEPAPPAEQPVEAAPPAEAAPLEVSE